MGYLNEFPHSRMWDSDLRQILEMYEEVKTLPQKWEEYKIEMNSLWSDFKAEMMTEWSNFQSGMIQTWEEFKLGMADDWARMTSEWQNMSNEWTTMKEEWSDLDTFVNEYFTNLDVQTEINNKINSMVADGSFGAILGEVAGTAGLPTSEHGGQFLVSTDLGGVEWLTVVNGNEVAY